jgi:hypothetical protein
MGTRSLTKIFSTYNDEKKNKQVKEQLVNMYRQYDGYPSGHGVELVDFLNSGKVVNGLGADDRNVFNGAGCLAAQMIAHFKNGAGGFYLMPIKSKNCGQEFEYEVIVDFDTHEVTLKCFEVWNKKKLIFEGKPSEFEQFVEELEEK